MKITKTQLKEIIKEELGALAEEPAADPRGEPVYHDASLELPEPEDTHILSIRGTHALKDIRDALKGLGMSKQARTIRKAVILILKEVGDHSVANIFEKETDDIGG